MTNSVGNSISQTPFITERSQGNASPLKPWKPTCTVDTLRARARILREIREFFFERDILEVDTPLLGLAPVTDPYLEAFQVQVGSTTRYLQTSPEYAMKRLLAAGSGSIFQICKAFRKDEFGRLHSPEFTMLEWYQLESNDRMLISVVDALLQTILHTPPSILITYQEAFDSCLALNPHETTVQELLPRVHTHCGEIPHLLTGNPSIDRDTCLQLLMSECVEPWAAHQYPDRPIMMIDYPSSQSALAQIKKHGTLSVAARFEVFYRGIELGNGYHELTDPETQALRFEEDAQKRRELGLPSVPVDDRLLSALEAGMPPCAGIALGLDRLIMLALGKNMIQEVVSFADQQADLGPVKP